MHGSTWIRPADSHLWLCLWIHTHTGATASLTPSRCASLILPRTLIFLRSSECVVLWRFADIVAGLAGFKPGVGSSGRRLLSLLPGEELFERLKLGLFLSWGVKRQYKRVVKAWSQLWCNSATLQLTAQWYVNEKITHTASLRTALIWTLVWVIRPELAVKSQVGETTHRLTCEHGHKYGYTHRLVLVNPPPPWAHVH